MSTWAVQRFQLAASWLLLAVLTIGISFVAVLYPWSALWVVILLLFMLAAARVLSGLRFWQQLTLIGLMGYVVLGYGFANLTLPRIPVPVGHLVMFAGLFLALPGRGADIRAFLREPLTWCWLGLSGLTLLHLVDNIPAQGVFAIRDSSLTVEGIFLLSGFLWARRRLGFPSMLRVLRSILLVNFIYALTYPASESLTAISPRSGIFLEVPLLGAYGHSPLFLIAGALFVFLLGRPAFKWPPLVVSALALLQLMWSLIFQSRAVYVGMIATGIILALTGGQRKAAKAVAAIAVSVLLVGLLGTLGFKFEGRVGSFTPQFLFEHVRSFVLRGDTVGVNTAQWRVDLVPEVMERWTASTRTVVIGEGFGQALIDWHDSSDVAVRQPHNTHVTVLMRLGIAGLLFWILFHARTTYLLITAVRAAPRATVAHGFAVWMLAFYAMGMLFTTVQPWLEFSMGAIPFYTLLGFAAGLKPPPTDRGHRHSVNG